MVQENQQHIAEAEQLLQVRIATHAAQRHQHLYVSLLTRACTWTGPVAVALLSCCQLYPACPCVLAPFVSHTFTPIVDEGPAAALLHAGSVPAAAGAAVGACGHLILRPPAGLRWRQTCCRPVDPPVGLPPALTREPVQRYQGCLSLCHADTHSEYRNFDDCDPAPWMSHGHARCHCHIQVSAPLARSGRWP